MSTPPRYRVEHRQPRRSTLLGVLVGLKPHRRTLHAYVSRLIHDGRTGWTASTRPAARQIGRISRLKVGDTVLACS